MEISYRLTPWDEVSLEMKTAEISLKDTFENSYSEVEEKLITVQKNLLDEGVEFCYTRVSSSDFKLRKLLQENGFYFAEVSQTISKNKIQKFDPIKLPKLKLKEANIDTDLTLIQDIAKDSFDFSRFHEDYNIPKEKSSFRYQNWISDLFRQNVIIHTALVGKKVVGLNIQKIDKNNNTADLILCGCKKGAELYVTSLWNEILKFNKEEGINKISTLISASNVNMANVYSFFGFKINETLFGFHKKLKTTK